MNPHPPQCSCRVCKYQRKRGIKPERAITEAGDEDDEEDFNYECTVCGTKTALEDYQKRTVGWCDDCSEIQYHEHLSDD